MFGNKKPKRFQEAFYDGSLMGYIRVIKDTETGVHYLCGYKNGEINAITPLLDENGNVVINKE